MSQAAVSRTILLAAPRSFCAGVQRAIEVVEFALDEHGPPVYVRKQIVHNAHVVAELRLGGAVFVDELDDVPHGALVIFSAHGVSPEVREQATARQLRVIDATCPLVSKVHARARRLERRGDTVVLIGHAGHEEIEGTMGHAPHVIQLVENVDDVDRVVAADPSRVTYLTQTTLSVADTTDIIQRLRARFPELIDPRSSDICYATTNRQDAVRAAAPGCDLFLIVGAPNSSNSKRLVEVAEKAGARMSMLVQRAEDIEWEQIGDISVVGLSAGASAPEIIVDEIIDAFKARFDVKIELAETTVETENFLVNREIRDVELTVKDMAFVNGEHRVVGISKLMQGK